jgi:hypothetical protein
MLRLIHTQSTQGAILVDDIDDGLPNKNVHRLGSTGDPAAYKRDGYANEPKQACYLPRTKPTDAAVAGYIDLNETQKVLLSAENGKIAGLQTAGLISVVSLTAADLASPTISGAVLAAGDLTISGTGFLSVSPEITTVEMWGPTLGGSEAAPAIILTAAQILAVAPGAVSNTSIVIDATLLGALAIADSVKVRADAQYSLPEVVA